MGLADSSDRFMARGKIPSGPLRPVACPQRSPADNCYNVITLWINGEFSKKQLRQVDDRTFVEGWRFVRADQPRYTRIVLTCDAQGSIAQGHMDMFVGAGEIQRDLSASFRKIR